MRRWVMVGILTLVIVGCGEKSAPVAETAPLKLNLITNKTAMILEDGTEVVILKLPAMT